MAYQHFLEEFAKIQGVADVDTLLTDHGTRYEFQINSRSRATDLINLLREQAQFSFEGKRVLDVGCAYGSFAIEMAKLGSTVVGIDVSQKWLDLAKTNARDEANVVFVNCDASSRRAKKELSPYGPFDLVLINDVFEHIYDTAGLLDTLCAIMRPGSRIYFKVPNGHATRSVLLEGHKKVFGLTQLAPDYWHMYIKAPFNIYYRRWEYFEALFARYGFVLEKNFNEINDESIDLTRRHILNDRNRIRRMLKAENFESSTHFATMRRACNSYIEELDDDVQNLGWEELHRKYRVTFWVGILKKQ